MPYLKVWIHLVWATRNREPVLKKEIRPEIFEHIRANAKAKDIHLDFINGHLDHVHALISLKSDQTISKVTQLLKGESSHWANKHVPMPERLEWQNEYFAISVNASEVKAVREYIRNQEEHHRKRTFGEEYAELLRQHGFAIGKEG